MKCLGFKVHVFRDETTASIERILDRYSRQRFHENANAFGLAFFSHGNQNGYLSTYDDQIHQDKLVDPFTNQRHLSFKPKLFFIQGLTTTLYLFLNIIFQLVVVVKRIVASKLIRHIMQDLLIQPLNLCQDGPLPQTHYLFSQQYVSRISFFVFFEFFSCQS